MSRWLRRLSMVRGFAVMGWWRISADRKRSVREVRLSWMRVIALWWTGAVFAAVERWFGEVWLLERRLGEVRFLEVWVVKLLIIGLISLAASVDLSVEVVSSILRLLGNCLGEALEAVTFFDFLFDVLRSVLTDRLFLLEDQILKLLELGLHPMEFNNIVFDTILRKVDILSDWLKSLRVRVGSNQVGDCEVRLDIQDFHRP
jgi:hypothetical protein